MNKAEAAQLREATALLPEVYRQILARTPEHDLVPSLDRIQHITTLLGDPQKAFESVHITGTNGKTSVTRMIERLLREHGLRTGRFLSPHLSDVRERIAVDGEPVDVMRFVGAYDELVPYLDLVDAQSTAAGGPTMTFFEVLVALAYAIFADVPVEVAAVEVGMGGSWDATNVIDAKVAVVTPIAVDHQRFLGSQITDIATEKAGIIKPGSTLVTAVQEPEVAQVLLHRAASVGANVAREGIEFGILHREVAVGGQQLALQGLSGEYHDIFLPLHGEYQASNAACALAAVEAFLGAKPGGEGEPGGLDADVVRAAFAGVDSPGRLEIVRRSPSIVVDAAHNPAGAAALAASIGDAFGFTRLVGLVAVLADKDAAGILEALEPVLDEVVITASRSARTMDPDELSEIACDIFGEDRVHVVSRLDAALDRAVSLSEGSGQPGSGVLATGSITLAGEVRVLLGVS